MEGSIADSTALRMRSQLQRAHHSAPSGNADGFLEELLKMPVAPVEDAREDVLSEQPVADQVAPTDKIKPGQEPSQADEDTDSEESSPEDDAQPCVVVCYGPAPIAQPEATPLDDAAVAEDAPAVSSVIESKGEVPEQVLDTSVTAGTNRQKMSRLLVKRILCPSI